MYDYLVVGSGLFGSIFAYEAKKRGKKVLVIERRNHTGGNIYCERKDDINTEPIFFIPAWKKYGRMSTGLLGLIIMLIRL